MNQNELKAMAVRIKERRISLGFTQENFSELIDISLSSYTKIENAFQKPSLDTLAKISQSLNISLDYIVFGTVEYKPKTVDNAELLGALLNFADKEKLLHVNEVISKLIKIKG